MKRLILLVLALAVLTLAGCRKEDGSSSGGVLPNVTPTGGTEATNPAETSEPTEPTAPPTTAPTTPPTTTPTTPPTTEPTTPPTTTPTTIPNEGVPPADEQDGDIFIPLG